MGWSKASAPLNMFFVFFKAVVSKFWMVTLPPLLKLVAPWNMPVMSVTATVFHESPSGLSSWLNAAAPKNISFMVVTTFVSQVDTSWSKNFAFLNNRGMSVTAVVFHLLPSDGMAWLNALAPLNMFYMDVTAAVFQSLMDGCPPLLKTAASSNIVIILVTAAVSQVPMFWLKTLAW